MPNVPEGERQGERLRLIVTAGHGRAPQAVALCQLLARDGHEIAAILIVSPFGLKRARALVRQGGVEALKGAARKLFAHRSGSTASAVISPLNAFFAAEGLKRTDLKSWARENGVACHVIDSLNGPAALRAVREAGASGVLFCGGGLLRGPVLDVAAGRVLNAHLGPLPEIRGMNAVEWSLLTGSTLTVTIHFIDAGVDTGPAVATAPIAREPSDSIETIRERSIVAAIGAMRRHVGALGRPLPPRDPQAASHRQYFTLAEPLRALLQDRLRGEAGAC